MSVMLRCPFCHWYRALQPGAIATGELERTLHELSRHMPAAHPEELKVWEKVIEKDAAEPRS